MAFLLTGFVILTLTAASVAPQVPLREPLSRDAIRRAVSVTLDSPQAGPQADWVRVMQLAANDEVTVVAGGQTPVSGRIVSVDQSGLTLRLASGGSTTRFERASIEEVRRTTRKRGSKLGAVIGAGAAGFAGVAMAIGLATKDCNGSCTDEKVGVGLSLIALPIGGGVAGYYLWPAQRRDEVIYTRPML